MVRRKRKGLTSAQKEILSLVTDTWNKHPDLRFTQLLFNLDVSGFVTPMAPDVNNFHHRDNYNDEDIDLLNRIKKTNITNNGV